jgi:phosphatidylinositol dimannoside acyltransferase
VFLNVVELGYGAAFGVIKRLPRAAVWPAFAAAADRGARRHRRGKSGRGTVRLAANLRRVVGDGMPADEFDDLLRRALRSYARYYLDAFQLPARSHQELLTGFRLERGMLLGDDIKAGRGAIVALPHAGNWDAAGAWVAANGWPITTVAERLKPEGVYEKFLDFRRSLGMEIIPSHGGDRPVFDVLEDRIKASTVVPLLADRDLTARGVEVEFFGGRTKMPAGPAALALRTGAPLYVASLWFDPDAAAGILEGPLTLPTDGPLDVRLRQTTQLIADHFAKGIARHPEDWHMLQRMWLDESQTATVSG